MIKKRIPAFLCCLLLFMTLLSSFASYAEENETPQTEMQTSEVTAEEAEEAEEAKELTGFKKFVNDFITARENGGIVTTIFGTRETVTFENGTTGTVYTRPDPYFGLTYLLMAVFSYVVGSVNFGVLVSRRLCNDDVRNYGSGNAGMTNVARVFGKKAAILTFLGDSLKAAICAFLGLVLAGNGCGYMALAFCLVGHAFPVFFKFRGGKGVASAFGGMLVLEPIAALILFFFFAVIVLGTKYVSLGSIIGSALVPLMVNICWKVGVTHSMMSYDYFMVTFCSVFYACFIIFMHKENIKRLYRGEENKTVLFGKKKDS